jgi:hypothetical protein
LGEFSPFGRLFKNSLSIPVFGLCTFSQTKWCVNSAEKMCWASFWAFLHKVAWSPWRRLMFPPIG